MQILLNGKLETVEKEMNIAEFILVKGLNPETIIVEYNGSLVKRQEWIHLILQGNDCLEILKFVGGG